MKIKIYQINSKRDTDHVKFKSLEAVKTIQCSQKIDADIYDRVFMGDVDCKDLEDVFLLFNTDGHRLHRGHSLSVSDIVETECGSAPRCYYCDSLGFHPVSFESEKAHVPNDLIRVLVVEPHRVPYESEIENTLEGQQRAVEGLIQYIYSEDGTVIVINDESKVNGMEGNRRIDGDVLVGPVFVAGDTGEDLCSLTDEQLIKYAERFAEPEDISEEEIAAHTGFTFISW